MTVNVSKPVEERGTPGGAMLNGAADALISRQYPFWLEHCWPGSGAR